MKALEQIVHEYPEEIEAKAFLALQVWQTAVPEYRSAATRRSMPYCAKSTRPIRCIRPTTTGFTCGTAKSPPRA